MSGRSAYVRKEKTKTKDGSHAEGEDTQSRPGSINGDLPRRSSGRETRSSANTDHGLPKSPLDDMAYARVRKPHVPILDVSGIEKSSFRSLMDKKSEGVRNGLAKTFGMKKKEDDPRPQTARAVRPESFGTDDEGQNYPGQKTVAGGPTMIRPRQEQHHPEYIRPGPPQGKLPQIPQGPQLKRWLGGGRPTQPWNKLKKDPELWDPDGDTLIYFAHEERHSGRPQPSFRISSRVLESTESRYFITALGEGSTEDANYFNHPPSPIDSLAMGVPQNLNSNRHHHTPPTSENSISAYDGQISYELYFPPPTHLSRTNAIRHQVSTRNVFAILYQASFVGVNFVQALKDVQERLKDYMPSSIDVPSMIIDYLISQGMDDIRENPSLAAAMLAWSEGDSIRWEEAWRESFVHCVGMHIKVEKSPDFRFVTPITRALLERASLEMQVRIHNCESCLSDFDFGDMFIMPKSSPTPARRAFDNLRLFFLQYYKRAYGSWPPAAATEEEQWFTREYAQRLQADFGALYNYLVNREIIWDCTEASAGRKWNMVHTGKRPFNADTPDLPLTDVLIAFDNRHSYPHIPHPYPLVPQSVSSKRSKEHPSKVSKKGPKPVEDKMAERRAALAYTESTNIYVLGSNFVSNDLVDQFVNFEKADLAAGSDPVESRRGRWVLIYGILQTLATVSVDTQSLHYTDVPYHLSANLRGTPPWRGVSDNSEGAEHTDSYCWTIPHTWTSSLSPTNTLHGGTHENARGGYGNYRDADSPSCLSAAENAEDGSVRLAPASPRRAGQRWWEESDRDDQGFSVTGYAPGIEKVDEWPISHDTVGRSTKSKLGRMIRDFDGYAI